MIRPTVQFGVSRGWGILLVFSVDRLTWKNEEEQTFILTSRQRVAKEGGRE